MFKSIAILFALAAAVLASGCGGSSSTTSSGPTLSRAAYIKQADLICKKSNKTEYEEAFAYARKHRGLENLQFEDARAKVRLAVAMPAVKKELGELEALAMPASSEQQIKAFFVAIEKAVKGTEKEPKSLENDAKDPFNPVIKLAREFGFKDCQEVT